MLSVNDFTKNKIRDHFVFEDEFCRIEIDTAYFTKEKIAFADRIRQLYPEKVKEIAQQFAADKRFAVICKSPTVEQIQESLGKPTFWFLVFDEQGSVNYYKHTFDKLFCLSIGFSGTMDKFRFPRVDYRR